MKPQIHAQIQKILSEGVPTLTTFFLYFGVQKEDPNTTKIGPSLAHRRNVI